MKDEDQIEQAINNVMEPDRQKYRGMTYEEGIRDALEWVIGNNSDDDFEYAGDSNG